MNSSGREQVFKPTCQGLWLYHAFINKDDSIHRFCVFYLPYTSFWDFWHDQNKTKVCFYGAYNYLNKTDIFRINSNKTLLSG